MGTSIAGALSDGWNAARNAISQGATVVGDASSGAASSVEDFSARALESAKDLGEKGLDLGRRGLDAARGFDVRKAADTVRQGIAHGTDAAREGIAEGVDWSARQVGRAGAWAESHVPGDDNGVANAARGFIRRATQETRFDIGVAGGVLREAASTAGVLGQLGTTALEMQASPQAAAEYGQRLADGARHLATMATDYMRDAADNPGRVARDIETAYDGAKQFVGKTADRYETAIRSGRTEEIGIDVGAAATYLVPIGGGPARGLAVAAAEDGARSLARVAVADGIKTAGADAGKAVAEQRGAALVDRLASGDGSARLAPGAGRVADIAAASRQSGKEIAVYRDADGQRMIIMGSKDAVEIPAGAKIIAHTQPGLGVAARAPSAADLKGLEALGQKGSAIIDEGGTVQRFHLGGKPSGEASARETVSFEAPRIPKDADKVTKMGGWAKYGALDDLGRPTGIQARITPDMIGSGTKANGSIHPPGWSGNGVLNNEARGHLLGNQLGGSGDDARNLVTLQQNPANSPVMRDYETQVRNTVETGENVDYTVTPVYAGDNLVPKELALAATGDKGFHLDVTIDNPIASK